MPNPERLRLLVVGITWPPETFVERLIAGLTGAGVDVTVACAEKPVSKKGINVQWLQTPGGNGSALKRTMKAGMMGVRAAVGGLNDTKAILKNSNGSPGRLQTIRRFLPFAGKRWDVIYFPWNDAAIAHLPLFDLGMPVVVSCRGAQVNIAPHDPARSSIRRGLKETFRRAAAVHCVSEAIKREAIQYGLDPEKASVIQPAVDTEFFHPVASQPSLQHSLRLITTGSLIWRKGYEYALTAARFLQERGVPFLFEIIGDGPERQRLLYTVKDMGLEKNVSLLGRLQPDLVRDHLQQADVFLLSSLSEGISNAVLEAMACGLPVVTTDCGGMREAVTDGVEGFVIPTRNPEAIADALERLARSIELRSRMSVAARARAVQDFSLEHQVKEWVTMLERRRHRADGKRVAA